MHTDRTRIGSGRERDAIFENSFLGNKGSYVFVKVTNCVNCYFYKIIKLSENKNL